MERPSRVPPEEPAELAAPLGQQPCDVGIEGFPVVAGSHMP
jgi:hypothetical protein